jgi:hypothetical protein
MEIWSGVKENKERVKMEMENFYRRMGREG